MPPLNPAYCPTCGALRVVVDRDRYSVTRRCTWGCGVSREEYEPDPRNDLQREWEIR